MTKVFIEKQDYIDIIVGNHEFQIHYLSDNEAMLFIGQNLYRIQNGKIIESKEHNEVQSPLYLF